MTTTSRPCTGAPGARTPLGRRGVAAVGGVVAGTLIGLGPRLTAGWVLSLLGVVALCLVVRRTAPTGPTALLTGAAAGAVGAALALGASGLTSVVGWGWLVSSAGLLAGVATGARLRSPLTSAAAAVTVAWVAQVLLAGRLPVDLVASGQAGGPLVAVAGLGGPLLVTGVVVGVAAAVASVPDVRGPRPAFIPVASWLVVGVALVAVGLLVPTSGTLPRVAARSLAGVGPGHTPDVLDAALAYGTDLTVLTGERRDDVGLARVPGGGQRVVALDVGGYAPAPWLRAAVDVGARLVLVPVTGPPSRLTIDQARLEAAAVGVPVALVTPGRRPVVITARGQLAGRLRSPGHHRGRGAGGGQARSRHPFFFAGDALVLSGAVVALAARRGAAGWAGARVRLGGVRWTGIAGRTVVAVGGCSLLGVVGGELVIRGPTRAAAHRVDAALFNDLTSHHVAWAVYAARIISKSAHPTGSFLVALGAGLIWLVGRRRIEPLVRLAVTAVAAEVITAVVKIVVSRPPPAATRTSGLNSSFPSGHSLEAAALGAVLLVVVRPQRRSTAVALWLVVSVWVLSVALSRVYLEQHWPSDTVAGIVLGGLCGALVGGWGRSARAGGVERAVGVDQAVGQPAGHGPAEG